MKASEVLAKVNKEYKAEVATIGGSTVRHPRLPTGILAFDLATGGGFPQGYGSIVYGPESSGKTTLVLKTIAVAQQLNPDKVAVFIDIEHHLDLVWAKLLGVDIERLIVIHPDYAEQVVDITEKFILAEDVCVVGLDSLAALITTNEAEDTAEKAVVGGSGLVVGKLYRKVTRCLGRVRTLEDRIPPTVLMINQLRYKIGVMFGDPETQPGGVAWKFGSCLTVRLYGKEVFAEGQDKKKDAPAIKTISLIVKKHKCTILARTAEFNLPVITSPELGLKIGHVDDWPTFQARLKDMELLKKSPSGSHWLMYAFREEGDFYEFPKLSDCEAFFAGNSEDPNFALRAKSALIDMLLGESDAVQE